MQLTDSFTGKQKKLVKTREVNGKTRGGTGIQEAQFAFPVAMFPFTPLGIAM